MAESKLPEEWLEARCTECDRDWRARGTLNCRRVLKRIQRHADQDRHLIDLQRANVR